MSRVSRRNSWLYGALLWLAQYRRVPVLHSKPFSAVATEKSVTAASVKGILGRGISNMMHRYGTYDRPKTESHWQSAVHPPPSPEHLSVKISAESWCGVANVGSLLVAVQTLELWIRGHKSGHSAGCTLRWSELAALLRLAQCRRMPVLHSKPFSAVATEGKVSLQPVFKGILGRGISIYIYIYIYILGVYIEKEIDR